MAIYAGEDQFKGFDEVIRKKRSDIAKKSKEKQERISQGNVPFLDEWNTTNATFDDMAGKGTDADSGYLTTDEGVSFGARANDIDTAEHSAYRNESTLRPYQKEHYARLWDIDVSQVNSAMVYEMGKKADVKFNALATEGQGVYDAEMGVVERSDYEGMEPQWYLPEVDVSYDPSDMKRAGSKRVKSTLSNPETGVDLYAAMNTPEFNTRWFDNNDKQTAIRESYEATNGNKYEEFKKGYDIPTVASKRMLDVDKRASYARAMGTPMPEEQTAEIPKDVKAAGRDGQVNIVTGKNSFSVYYPARKDKVGFYKTELTLEEARWYKQEIEANPDAEADVNSWTNVGNELASGGVSVNQGFKRALDDGPLTKLEGVDQWNQLVGTHTNWWQSPQNRDLKALGHTGDSKVITENDVISKEDQANHRAIETKLALGDQLSEDEILFSQQPKFTYLSSLDSKVINRVARDNKSLAKEAEAASKVNRRQSGFEKKVAEKIYDDSGWDYLVYSLQNRKVSAVHSLVESAAFMGELMIPYVGVAAAIASAQENFKREYTDIHGEVPEGSDLALLNSMAVVSIAAEKLGVKAITGRLPNLTTWVSEIGIKNPLVSMVVKPVAAVLVPATIEGISGLTSTTAETIAKHGIQEDGSVVTPTGFEASEGFVNEAMGGLSISAPVSAIKAAKNTISPSLKTTVDKIAKRAEVLKDETLSDKQKVNVEKSRDKLVDKLISKRGDKIKAFQPKYGDARTEWMDIDAYLDEINVLAIAEKSLDKKILDTTHVANLSYALLETLKQGNSQTDIDFRLIKGLERGIKMYEQQIELDRALATAGNFTSANAKSVDTVNAAKERVRSFEQDNANINIKYTTEDFQERIDKEPHKEGLFTTQRDEHIATIKEDLQQALDTIGENIEVGLKAKTDTVQKSKETNRLNFSAVTGMDVKSTDYNPYTSVLTILSEMDNNKAIGADTAISLLKHHKNLKTVVAGMKREGKTDADIQDYVDILDESQYVLEDIAAEQVTRLKDGSADKLNPNDYVLQSLNINEIDVTALDELANKSEELTTEQQALLKSQKKRLDR